MSYTTAKTNWIASDYFNVVDWNRIYNNSHLASALAAILRAETIVFDVVAMPAISDNPQTAGGKLNTILANIERLRLAVADEAIAGALLEIKDDWELGPDKAVPNYNHANLWESTIDAIWEYFDGPSLDICPTLTADLTIPTGTQYIVVDCIDPDTFEIIIEGTGELFVI